MSFQGNPCWYELTTSKGDLKAAGEFYARVLGWAVHDSGMPDFAYHLATSGGDMVAGLTEPPGEGAQRPPMWLIYFAADDADATARQIAKRGGSILSEPADIPGTGRYAVAADPQGAAFGILQPDMSQMADADRAKAERGEGAFDPQKPGHGNWNELMSTDPEAGYAFYSALFGWTRGEAMPMDECPDASEGPGGTYQMIRHKGADIGAIMGLGDAPHPNWLPYFGVEAPVSEVIETIRAAGGHVQIGPIEVPGPAWIAVGSDPQGAWFAVVGPRQ